MSLTTKDIPSLANYSFIFYSITWGAISAFLVSIDGYGRLGMILLAIAILLNFRNQNYWNTFRVPAITVWTIWVIIEWIRWNIEGLLPEGTPDKWYFTYYNFIRALGALTISAYEMNRNPYRFLKIVLASFLIYVLMGVIFQFRVGTNLRESDDNLLGNMLPLASLAMVATGMISYYFTSLKQREIYLLLALSALTIMVCATRKAFGGMMILFFFWYISNSNLKRAKDFFILIIGILIVLVAAEYITNYTSIGERFSEIKTQSHGYDDNLFLKFTGDRAIQYLLGWDLFAENPIWGIGILNFMHYAHYGFQLHTEYMVQLTECGIVGFTIFLLFYYQIFRQISIASKTNKHLSLICYGWMCCIIFLNFTAWTFNFPFYFTVFGLIIGGTKYITVNKTTSTKLAS